MPITRDIQQAVRVLREGGLVGLPTETVYGLAADAENEIAVRSIFAAKGRPAGHPLIVHLASANQIANWVTELSADAQALAAKFWPGPLTLILRRNEKAAPAVTGGLETIGLRVPAHPIARQVLREFGGGLAAPSANRFGRVSPTSATHVLEELGDTLPLVLEGGDCAVGIESTIVDLSSGEPCLLRPGFISADEIEAVLGRPLADPEQNATRCSGRLASHYAPRAAVEVVSMAHLVPRARYWLSAGLRLAVLSSALPEELADVIADVIFIPLANEPIECARRLYSALREADAAGAEIALVVPPRASGIGIAIVDRLLKAAAPRI